MFERREDLEDLGELQARNASALAAICEVARDRQRREDAAVVGHPADARAAISWVGSAVMSRPSKRIAPRRGA
jgi:hypothetical protein